MPPKGRVTGPPAARQNRTGYARTVINELTSSENRSVVIGISFFAAGVAFLHSSWSEILLPPHWYGYEHHFTCAATSSLRPVCLRRSEANLGTADGHRKDRDSDDNAAVRTPS
ncbi:hypothetical protein M8818_007362 [Zalaria obscura]|uniref:Uncharacterized protein n=1 Tax=Zalaria obscura TaxID=2024903 RepID=A0ACC3S333_9PEZI